MICDNDFLINEQRLIRFCELLEQRNIHKKYMCYGSVTSLLEKPSLLGRLNKNGLMAVIVGYEAFDDKILQSYNKNATTNQNLAATRLLQANHIACWGSFIIDPDWDKNDFKRLLRYIKRLKPELITFSPLVPHPLTNLYETYKERLIYSVEEYDKWNFGDVLIYPSKMSLKAYYVQVLKLAIVVNFNRTAVNYTRKNIPLRNSLKMVLGFNNLFGVYVKNMFIRK
jgi:hopanoid C-3 methylase